MARSSPVFPLWALGLALFLAACGKSGPAPDIIDAAELYAANERLIGSIRGTYPGPYVKFYRIPARNPADETSRDRAFFANLRNSLPVEFIDFFPIGNTNEDEIDVVLWRYDRKGQWNTVGLVYFSKSRTLAKEDQSMRGFQRCGGDVRYWLDSRDENSKTSAFCRINDNWHAYHRIE